MSRWWYPSLIIAGAIFIATSAIGAQPARIDFSDPGWTLQGEGTRVAIEEGTSVLRVRTGRAGFPSLRLEDGTIEFDVRMSPYRAFVYLAFRMQSPTEHEEIYLRAHKSGLPDAVQYTPVFRGVSNWQLYHGAGATAAPRFAHDRWVRVRLVVQGTRAALYIGDGASPALVVGELAREPAAGFIELRCLLADTAAPPDADCARFRDLEVRPNDVGGGVPALTGGAAGEGGAGARAGTITRWRVSAPFAADSGAIERIPPSLGALPSWSEVATDRRGLLVLYRHVAAPAGTRRPGVMAGVRVTADRERVVPLEIGFSDAVTVFLNGRPLFHREDSYSFDRPRREGLIGLDQGTVYLPLREGVNDVVLAVSDVFGGWGVMGRFPRADGLRLH